MGVSFSTCERKIMQRSRISTRGYVCVGPAVNKGRGVFACRTIRKGTLIEECPVIIVSAEDSEALYGTNVRRLQNTEG